jgi:putative endonuclease
VTGSDWKETLRAKGLVRKRGAERPARAHPATTPAGLEGEALAARHLEERGVVVLGRNVRTAGGEIDLVARRGELLLFVEVKRRRTAGRGTGAEAVTPFKRRRIVRAARAWLAENPEGQRRDVRFDVVAVQDEPFEIEWIQGAFDAC